MYRTFQTMNTFFIRSIMDKIKQNCDAKTGLFYHTNQHFIPIIKRDQELHLAPQVFIPIIIRHNNSAFY